jgi:hypothetical protein
MSPKPIYIHISHTAKFSKQPKLTSINSLSLHGKTILQDFTFLAASMADPEFL